MELNKLMVLLFGFLAFSCRNEPENGASKVGLLQTTQSPPKSVLKFSNTSYPFVIDFEKFVYETMSETHIPGAGVAIVKDNEVLLLKGYGVKSFGSNDSVDEHTVFRIASVSKGFASMLAGILVQEKQISWDDKVSTLMPGFKLNDSLYSKHLTIRHILSHTSGLPRHTFTNMIEESVPYDHLRDKLSTVEMEPPGKVFAYQNVAYSLISDIVAVSTKKTYEALLREKIFNPLGMADASASYEAIMAARNVALPHLRRTGVKFAPTQNTPEYYSVLPAAGVNASTSDMAKWLLALLGNRQDVITQATLDEIFKPEIETPRRRKYGFFHWHYLKSAYYGLGWRILDYGGKTIVYHGGHVNGFRAEVAICPADHIGIAILTNASGKLANDGVEVFFDSVLAHEKITGTKKAD